jgi:hypothetical protein
MGFDGGLAGRPPGGFKPSFPCIQVLSPSNRAACLDSGWDSNHFPFSTSFSLHSPIGLRPLLQERYGAVSAPAAIFSKEDLMRLVKILFVLCTAILLAGVVFHTAVLRADGGRPYPIPPKQVADGGRPYPIPPKSAATIFLVADGGRPYPIPPKA